MLTFFKPWCTGNDLKELNTTWDEEFNRYKFTAQQNQLLQNFNIRYECLDARDDYRAQMKKLVDPLFVDNWEDSTDDIENTKDPSLDANIEFDDEPQDLQNIENTQILRMKNFAQMNQVLNETAWSKENLKSGYVVHHFKPDKILSGSDWNAEVSKKHQEIIDKRNLYNNAKKKEINKQPHLNLNHDINSVKIIDKSYLQKDFNGGVHQKVITESFENFNLNSEQKRAFQIIANHAVSGSGDQLKMYLGGMGGTGKSQVIKALSYFFEKRNESHRFTIVGSAAALLGGSTYHYLFGINEYTKISNISQVKSRLEV